ncbi:MAG TPA: hypothetical protein HA345_02740 [Candidatus Thalassarchaeaceae archaeon]|nr:MAG TPA: hypothetical protein D7H94_02730 [Candidatus Poseidoniales archaeon]HIH84305.1 hypothetical protein [Candidatus Thalassarchaeaceae archaeon]|tara:strand:+ start:420 stop:794 length:375 start_codon:yes stop_codon:yes gene_type:complete
MASKSPMVSLRIPEDHLMMLEQLVGFDGMRNRSDVIRHAVRLLLESGPSRAVGGTVKVDLGPDLTEKLDMFCQINGDTPETVTRYALRDHMNAVMDQGETLQTKMEQRLKNLHDKSRQNEDHTA